jgi:hypothetical protein
MTASLIAYIVLALGILAIFAALWREERRKRRKAEDRELVARVRGDYLESQVPFPRGEELPW